VISAVGKLSYLLVIPAAVRLRRLYPELERPFRVPVSDRGFAALGYLSFAWVLLGSWIAVFPGTLERLFGLDYDFRETWGVSQAEFETFTLGTLGFLLILGAVGYMRGARVRQHAVAIDDNPAPALDAARTEGHA
jgi:amino acid transporter